jgi:5-methylcytosine-specific restriction endonuclease McrA
MRSTPLRPSLKPIPRYTALRPVGPAKAKRDAKYKKYMASAAWKKKRDAVIARAAGNCERCGTPFADQGVTTCHHVTYVRFGHERLTDLIAICWACNEDFHGNAYWRSRHRRITS